MEDTVPYKKLINAMVQQTEEDKIFMEKATAAIANLNLHNSIQAQELVALADTLTEFDIESFNDPANDICLSESGMSANIAATLSAVHDYAQPSNRGGGQLYDLDIALIGIFKEKERRIVNE